MSNYIRWDTRRSWSLERDSRYATTVRLKIKDECFQFENIWFDRKLVVPGDLKSYGGGNGLPRTVKQSPEFSRIIEEDEEEEEEAEEEEQQQQEENENEVSVLLVIFCCLSKTQIWLSICFWFHLASTNANAIDNSNIEK